MNGPESKYCLGERGRGGIYVEEKEGGRREGEEDQRWGFKYVGNESTQIVQLSLAW